MDEIVPTTYATIELRSERLGELQQCLMAHGFALKYVQSPKREFWAIEDEDQSQAGPGSAA
jgi:hypothetical protein